MLVFKKMKQILILLGVILIACTSENRSSNVQEINTPITKNKQTIMEELREFDPYLSRWLGASMSGKVKNDLLEGEAWSVDLYAKSDGLGSEIKIDLNRDGEINEKWELQDSNIIRIVIGSNQKYLYTTEGWKSY